jgi:hypothetical protein
MASVKNVLPIVQSTKLIGQAVAYYPNIANVINSTDATLFICQFIYWSDNIDENGISNWIKRTSAEIQQFTGVNQNSQVTARKRLINLGILTEKKMGIPSTLHFQFDFNKLNEILSEGLNEEKKDKNSTQKKNEKGRFVSVSEKLGNCENMPVSENPSFIKSGSKVSEKVANCKGTNSETTYIRDIYKNNKEREDAHAKKENDFFLKEENENFVEVAPAAAESPKKVILDEMKMKVEFLPHEEVYENLINHFELNDERKLKIFQDRRIDEKSLSESEFVILLKDFSIYYIGSRKYTGTANVGHSIPEFERWLGWQSNDINDGRYFEDRKKTLKREAKDEKLKQQTTQQATQPQIRDLSLLAKQVQEKWKQKAAQ